MNTTDQLSATHGSPARPQTMDEWFLSLPINRRDSLREDKWMLAQAAFIAGAQAGQKETPPAAPCPLDQYENCLIQYLKRSGNNCPPRLEDLRVIWAWRCGIDAQYIHLTDLAESLYVLCERLDLLGPSLSIFPGGRGGFGVIADAAPDRAWALGLDAGDLDSPLNCPDRLYWFRIIAVLCSRLRMSEVAKLPGYVYNASAGQFGGHGAAVS